MTNFKGIFGVLGVLTLFLALGACTDAKWGKLQAFGGKAHVRCFSGGIEIYSGMSTGKVISEANSDGYNFVDAKTKKLMEVSGECVITYKAY